MDVAAPQHGRAQLLERIDHGSAPPSPPRPQGPIRARDLDDAAIPRTYLARLCKRGVLEQVDRGLYRLVDAPVTELHSLAEVAKRVPHAVIYLLSALQVHELTTEVQHAVWIMIDTHARAPAIGCPQVELCARAATLARMEKEYGEIRAVLIARLAAAKIRVQIDVGFGNVITLRQSTSTTQRFSSFQRHICVPIHVKASSPKSSKRSCISGSQIAA